jgi:hypothetical protein
MVSLKLESAWSDLSFMSSEYVRATRDDFVYPPRNCHNSPDLPAVKSPLQPSFFWPTECTDSLRRDRGPSCSQNIFLNLAGRSFG